MKKRAPNLSRRFRIRVAVCAVALAGCGVVLAGRAVQLQLLESDFLESRADAQQLHEAIVVARRGRILDRHGQPLAVSAPVDSFWAHPGSLEELRPFLPEVGTLLETPPGEIERRLTDAEGREFLWLRRGLPPGRSQQVQALNAPGLHVRREYRRYYPAGEIAGHLVGFAGIDENGLEGLELAFEPWLKGRDGRKQVIRDRLGRHVRDIAGLAPLERGRDLRLGLDLRLQYLAHSELQEAVKRHQAQSGSIVMLDARSGEVLAMVSQPSFNPNNRGRLEPGRTRNRAALDLFEPGSTIKPFVLAAALESGAWNIGRTIDTGPGFIRVGPKRIEDRNPLGVIDLATLMRRSSQVGATIVAMELEPHRFWETLAGVGFGRATESGFPGESGGSLDNYKYWKPVDQAVMGYGYGVAVSALQLARAYAVFANGGRAIPVSLIRTGEDPQGVRVFSGRSAAIMTDLLQEPVGPGGTATAAQIPGYRVAGKTGTVEKLGANGYQSDRHTALFVGYAPASRPRVVAVVVIDDPRAGGYFGGQVAAPVFSRVVAGALRLMGAPMDGVPQEAGTMVAAR